MPEVVAQFFVVLFLDCHIHVVIPGYKSSMTNGT